MTDDDERKTIDQDPLQWSSDRNQAQENRFWDFIGLLIVGGLYGLYRLLAG